MMNRLLYSSNSTEKEWAMSTDTLVLYKKFDTVQFLHNTVQHSVDNGF